MIARGLLVVPVWEPLLQSEGFFVGTLTYLFSWYFISDPSVTCKPNVTIRKKVGGRRRKALVQSSTGDCEPFDCNGLEVHSFQLISLDSQNFIMKIFRPLRENLATPMVI